MTLNNNYDLIEVGGEHDYSLRIHGGEVEVRHVGVGHLVARPDLNAGRGMTQDELIDYCSDSIIRDADEDEPVIAHLPPHIKADIRKQVSEVITASGAVAVEWRDEGECVSELYARGNRVATLNACEGGCDVWLGEVDNDPDQSFEYRNTYTRDPQLMSRKIAAVLRKALPAELQLPEGSEGHIESLLDAAIRG